MYLNQISKDVCVKVCIVNTKTIKHKYQTSQYSLTIDKVFTFITSLFENS